MPPPGPDFLFQAAALADGTVVTPATKATKKKAAAGPVFVAGKDLRRMYRRALREPGFGLPVTVRKGQRESVEFIPGHLWGQHWEDAVRAASDAAFEPRPVDGPHRADVMVIGKMPWKEEHRARRNLIGPTGEVLLDALRKLRVKGMKRWYVTNLVKFVPPTGDTNLKADWIKDCLPLLHAELRIVRPKYILVLGTDASKALLGPKATVSYMDGRVTEFTYDCRRKADDPPDDHTALVSVVIHPANVARDQAQARILERGLARFALLLSGVRCDKEEEGLDHRVITSYEEAEAWVEEVDRHFAFAPRAERLVAWDAEWQGQHPINPGAYLRCIQASWAPKKAVAFKLRHAGGAKAFRDADGKPAIKRLYELLNRFMADKRPVGHFLVADLEFMRHAGMDPTAHAKIPLDPAADGTPAWARLRRGEGWLDTAMMCHAVEETAPLGLESLAMRYTTAPRYDIPLEDWKKAYCAERGIKPAALEGYGECPDEILLPYATYDADVTLRAALALLPLLDRDYDGNNAWEACWESMLAQKPILEVHETGIVVNRRRVDFLTEAFYNARAVQEKAVRRWAKWPDFNIRSVIQVREFLFGEARNGKVVGPGETGRVRPPKAKSLYLQPLLDTSKPPKRWADIVEQGLEDRHTPGTSKLILSILAQDNLDWADQVNYVRDYRFLDQVLKSVLRKPRVDDEDSWIENDDGELEYDAGLAAAIDVDGRVRTHLYPTAETGRWKSSRPNLQNISKRRDRDYARLLAEAYKHKLRSVFEAAPGHALIEFDYKGAELYVMALMSGDPTMTDHAERSNYPDEGFDERGRPCKGGKFPHPKYYDIHSNIAVQAFQLACAPTKAALKAAGYGYFRDLAKTVIFGIAYGRGAKAIALAAREEKVKVSVEEAQQVIDAVFAVYPMLDPFFAECRRRAKEEKCLCHGFGRWRRFPAASEFKLEGEFERQAMNFPIQGMIASAVDRGLARLLHVRDEVLRRPDLFRLLLQIHDAGIVEVPFAHVEYVAEVLIPYAMRDCVPLYPTDLAGVPTGAGPFYLGIETSVERSWGEKFTAAECAEYGIPAKYAA